MNLTMGKILKELITQTLRHQVVHNSGTRMSGQTLGQSRRRRTTQGLV